MAAFSVHNDIYIENKILNTYYNMNKKVIRLTESDLHRIVKETVGILLERTYYNGNGMLNEGYHWSISEANYPELEALNCVDSSAQGYKTPETAYNYGLKHLKKYRHGTYILEVYHWPTEKQYGKEYGAEYDEGYSAVIHNGVIKEY